MERSKDPTLRWLFTPCLCAGHFLSRRTRPVPVEDVLGKPVHGHVFRLQADGTFVPYELEEGEVNLRATAVAPGFFQEFASFLYLSKLSDPVALQALDDAKEERRVELLVGSEGTLMVDEKDMVQLQPATLTTGWSFQVRNDGIISCKGKDVYSPTQKHTHRVFQDTKLLKTVGDWQKALVEEGILADE